MSRSSKKFAAYVPATCQGGGGTEVTFETSSDKYRYAGLVLPLNGGGQWDVAVVGWSAESVTSRNRTQANKRLGAYRGQAWALDRYTGTSIAWEHTAPVVREYFGHHRVAVTAVFFPGEGWTERDYHGGKSLLRMLKGDGVTHVRFTGRGTFEGERPGVHAADFTMDELLKSMNARKKS
jgi:hypothetical protein